MKGETLTQRIIRKYEMGQSWCYTRGCTCRGCKAWLRTMRARRRAKKVAFSATPHERPHGIGGT